MTQSEQAPKEFKSDDERKAAAKMQEMYGLKLFNAYLFGRLNKKSQKKMSAQFNELTRKIKYEREQEKNDLESIDWDSIEEIKY